jgi:hypothetical protein
MIRDGDQRMDDRRFDQLARRLGASISRRDALRSAFAGVLGLGAARVFTGSADAKAVCRGENVVCSKNADCCSEQCLPANRQGRRLCLAVGFELCNGVVTPVASFDTDVENCGACGHVCPAAGPCQTRVCVAGVCGTPADTSLNGQSCDDGNLCTQQDQCQNGICTGVPVECEQHPVCTTSACDPATGQCALTNDPDNTPIPGGFCCGGDFCATGLPCVNGVCQCIAPFNVAIGMSTAAQPADQACLNATNQCCDLASTNAQDTVDVNGNHTCTVICGSIIG